MEWRFPSIWVAGAAMMATWGLHDLLQEKVFRFPGFSYGLLMSLFLQVVAAACASFSQIRRGNEEPQQNKQVEDEEDTAPSDTLSRPVLFHYLGLSAAIAASNGLSTMSLNYVNQPAKILFKSCKLLPVMVMGVVLGTERHRLVDYACAAVMCLGLGIFLTADVSVAAQFSIIGVGMLLLAITADAVAPNVQQRLLQQLGQKKEEVVLYTNWLSALITLGAMVVRGSVVPSFAFLFTYPEVVMWLTAQSLAGYFGIVVFLMCIESFGSRVTIILTSLRKILTIALSYLLFRKPFHVLHLAGVAMVLGAVTLNSMMKKKKGGDDVPPKELDEREGLCKQVAVNMPPESPARKSPTPTP